MKLILVLALFLATLFREPLVQAYGGHRKLTDAKSAHLIPVLAHPMSDVIVVKNIGTISAPPSKLTLDCEKEATPPQTPACPDLPPSVAQTYFDPAFPKNATIQIPGLPPGGVYKHKLSFWNMLRWTKGKYRFTAVADAAHEVNMKREESSATSFLFVQ